MESNRIALKRSLSPRQGGRDRSLARWGIGRRACPQPAPRSRLIDIAWMALII
jgi:hypothetical protein